MSTTPMTRVSILILAAGLAAFSVSAEARIVVEPRTAVASGGDASGAGRWVPASHFKGGVLPLPLIAAPLLSMPLACDLRADPARLGRVDRLLQQRHLTHTLARARFWRSQR